jgi:hypothetical protein
MALNSSSRVAYDDSLHNLLILHDHKLYLVNPDDNPQVVKSFKTEIEDQSAFHTLERRPAGSYFLTSTRECIAFNPNTETLASHSYPSPPDAEGMFISMVNSELAATRSIYLHEGARNAQVAENKAALASVGMLPPGAGNTERKKAQHQYFAADALDFAISVMPPARWEAFSQSSDFAYYFAAEKGQSVLVKVNKNTGAEADKLLFDNARPLYRVDEIQRRIYYANKGVLKVFNL